MRIAVDLNRQPRIGAIEVKNVSAKGHLPLEFPTINLAVAQTGPEDVLSVGLMSAHSAAVRRDALATVTRDLQNVVQFEHMASVYDASYGSHGQLLRNGWTEPTATRLTFGRVDRRTYCVTGTLHGITRTVRQNEVISALPC